MLIVQPITLRTSDEELQVEENANLSHKREKKQTKIECKLKKKKSVYLLLNPTSNLNENM